LMWIEKQRYIVDYTIASLLRRKGKNLALLSVYTIVIFLLASILLFTHAIKREASLVLENAPEMVVQRLVAGRHDLMPVSHVEIIKKIKGVYEVKGRLWGYYYDPTNGANYTLMVDERISNAPGSIIIGKGVARNLPGEDYGMIPLKTSAGSYLFLKVADILPAESELVSADLILMSEIDFRTMFGIPEQYVTDITLQVRNPKEYTTIATKISQALPDSRPILREEILRTYDAVFDWRGGLLIVILLGSVLSFLILAWDRSAGLSAEEKLAGGDRLLNLRCRMRLAYGEEVDSRRIAAGAPCECP